MFCNFDTIVIVPHTFSDQNGCLLICKQKGRIAGSIMAHNLLADILLDIRSPLSKW